MTYALLSHAGLRALREEYAGRAVLSVYLDASVRDPAGQGRWRTALGNELNAILRSLVGASERREFAAAVGHLHAALAKYDGHLPGRAWSAFVTADGVAHAGSLPVVVKQRLRWGRAPLLGPYLRVLKQHRPVITAIVDSARARIFRYELGEVLELLDYRSDRFIDDLTDRNTSKHAATHSGIRGETATDAAERTLQVEMQRMLADVALAVQRAAGEDGLVLIGGATQARAELRRMLPASIGARMAENESLYVAMPTSIASVAVEANASALTRRLQRKAAAEIIELAGKAGRAVLGPEAALLAARNGQIELLLLATWFTAKREELAEALIAETLVHGGAVDEVAGDAAALLDAATGGVAARLRFVRKPAVALPPLDAAG